jgi:hypothetical protein
VDVDDRMKRWYTVVQRVEERFAERLRELEEKVHWWYLEVRELEVQEVRLLYVCFFFSHVSLVPPYHHGSQIICSTSSR